MNSIDQNRENFLNKSLSLFNFPPTEGQQRLLYAFSRLMYTQKERCALLLKGYAGTGKTTSVAVMVRTLQSMGINCVLLAPTGRAAKVLSGYSNMAAETIHRRIYIRLMDRAGNSFFELKENTEENTVFFVDEASMIGTERFALARGEVASGDLLEDLISHIYSGNNCKLVLIGDNAQLPPVGSEKSPALMLEYLRNEFHLMIAEVELTEVIRQQAGSGILQNATAIRQMIISENKDFPELTASGFDDVVILNADLKEEVEQSIGTYGIDGTIMITRSNKRANLFNQQIRLGILGNEEEINQGDRMMVLKNNYFWLIEQPASPAGFIANGDTIRIERILKFEERGSFRFCRATISLIDYPEMQEFDVILLCNSIWEESSALPYEKVKELFTEIAKDYEDEGSLRQIRKAVQKDPYYNALQVKFAYAITCHKAQGGQWPCVFVDKGYVTPEMHGVEMNRWLYTAVTRAREKLYLVGFEEN